MIVDKCRDIEEFKKLHSECNYDDIHSADGILALDDYCFCFYNENTGKLAGCIYLEDDEGKVCLCGFAARKNYNIVMEAIKKVSDYFHLDDLYAQTDKKSAIMVLLRSGFKKIDDITYLRKAF